MAQGWFPASWISEHSPEIKLIIVLIRKPFRAVATVVFPYFPLEYKSKDIFLSIFNTETDFMSQQYSNEEFKVRFGKFLRHLKRTIVLYLDMGNKQENYNWLRSEISTNLEQNFFFLMELSVIVRWFELGDYDPNVLTFEEVPDMLAGSIVVDLNEVDQQYRRSHH